MKNCLKCILLVFAILFVIFFLTISIFVASFSETILVPNNSMLHVTLYGTLPEYVPEDELSDLLDVKSAPLTMHDLRRSFTLAANDNRIAGIVLKFASTQISFSHVLEIRSLIEKFKQSGKPIYSYLDIVDNKSYLIASGTDAMVMTPEGQLYLNKLQASLTFLKEGLNKLGVSADFLSVGKYKSAPEQFTRNNMSERSREQFRALIDNNQQILDSLLAEAVNDALNIKNIYQQAVFDSYLATEKQMVDSIMYWDQFQAEYHAHWKRYKSISLRRYLKSFVGDTGEGSRVALIYVNGAIMPGGDSEDALMGSISGSDRIIRNIRSAVKSRSIKAILLRIDSPGGASIAADKIYREIQIARKEKPVIASVGSMAASGGYYIAMACDTIITNEASLVGSIGVFMGKFDVSRLKADKLGIQSDRIVQDKGNDIDFFSSDRRFTRQERRLLQGQLDRFYQRFLNKVAESRQMSLEDVAQVAEGRVWTGKEGLNKGLIDQTGDFFTAVDHIKSKIKANNIRFRVFPGKRSIFESLDRAISIQNTLRNPLMELERWLQIRSWALMPVNIEIN